MQRFTLLVRQSPGVKPSLPGPAPCNSPDFAAPAQECECLERCLGCAMMQAKGGTAGGGGTFQIQARLLSSTSCKDRGAGPGHAGQSAARLGPLLFVRLCRKREGGRGASDLHFDSAEHTEI